MRRDHDLVDVLRGEHVLHGCERLVVEHRAVRGDAREPERGEHAVEPAARGSTARVAVDDVATARLGHGRDDGDPNRPLRGTTPDGVDELVADERLVRDHEDEGGHVVRHAGTSCASCASLAGLKIACRAPGTPYSYGPPTTWGISSKLKIGGGEVTCHSRVRACQGFASATGPRCQLVT